MVPEMGQNTVIIDIINSLIINYKGSALAAVSFYNEL